MTSNNGKKGKGKDPDDVLGKDIDVLFDDDDGLLSGLEDTPKQTVTNMIVAFRAADDARSKVVYQRRLARTSKDRDGVKNANASVVTIRQTLIQVVRDLLDALEQHPEFYREVSNWLDWPKNLRPILRKQMKARGHDVGSYIDATEEIEAERRRVNEASTIADSDTHLAAAAALEASQASAGRN